MPRSEVIEYQVRIDPGTRARYMRLRVAAAPASLYLIFIEDEQDRYEWVQWDAGQGANGDAFILPMHYYEPLYHMFQTEKPVVAEWQVSPGQNPVLHFSTGGEWLGEGPEDSRGGTPWAEFIQQLLTG